jgi:hypothetical protein
MLCKKEPPEGGSFLLHVQAQWQQQQRMRSAIIMIQQQLSPKRLPKQLFITDPP